MNPQYLGEPFVGVTTGGNVVDGLFNIRSSGVSTEAIQAAAEAFIAALDSGQRQAISFAVDDETAWRDWNNVDNYARQGVGFDEMTDEQRSAAWSLLDATLSAAGVDTVRKIMQLNLVEGELLGQTERFNEDLYWLMMFGEPSSTGPWGFQLEGHHLIIDVFVLGDQLVMTPTFLGSEPTHAPEGTTYAGEEVLQDKQDAGLALMQALDAEQQARATIETDKTGDDLVAGAFSDNLVLDYAGLAASEMTEAQRQLLMDVVRQYVGDMNDGHAEVKMGEVEAHLDETVFAWIGGTGDDAVFYYRVQSPVVLIEFDHELPGPLRSNPAYASNVPTRAHIHTIIRTPNGNDYGRDLLRQHLIESHGLGETAQ
jgi:hypothetical protein